MQRLTLSDAGTPFERVSKYQARKAWSLGKPVVLCPVNLHPFGAWRPSVMVQKTPEEDRDFDYVALNFAWYNCTCNETGRYPAFYVKREG